MGARAPSRRDAAGPHWPPRGRRPWCAGLHGGVADGPRGRGQLAGPAGARLAQPPPPDRRFAGRGGRQLDAPAIYGPFRRAGASSGRPLSGRPHNGAAAAAELAPAAACTGRGPGAARACGASGRESSGRRAPGCRAQPCAPPARRPRDPRPDGAPAPPAGRRAPAPPGWHGRAAESRAHTQGPILRGSAQPYGKSASTRQPPLIQAQNVPQQGTITTLFASIMDANGREKKKSFNSER